MKKGLYLSMILFLWIGSTPAHADRCASFVVKGIELKGCLDDDGLVVYVQGHEAGRGRLVKGASYFYRFEVTPVSGRFPGTNINFLPSVTRVRLEVNSYGNEYRDKLIAEICVNDPTFVKLQGSNLQIGQNRCSPWIILGPMPYIGPRGECYGPTNDECRNK